MSFNVNHVESLQFEIYFWVELNGPLVFKRLKRN